MEVVRKSRHSGRPEDGATELAKAIHDEFERRLLSSFFFTRCVSLTYESGTYNTYESKTLVLSAVTYLTWGLRLLTSLQRLGER
ncbi:hypothetical protein Y032_0046g1410 [Ancylostoma ceylanicum]|uniref:Uncharacterized protein n=1 Tax=Ancylostoma ceylanicum TaxID=53326 RepID=A0A016UBQ6_9BILA|nr:hypothetical protein Y032_0046g1410 [Ancylostoma ceylanicum]